jgi:uncharacterized membrane protein
MKVMNNGSPKFSLTSIIVLISIGLNIFLIAMWVGRAGAQTSSDSQTRRSIQAMLAPLPSASRDLVRKEIAIVMPRVKERFSSLTRARSALAQEMTNPAISQVELEQRFSQVQEHTTAIGKELQQAMAKALPQLSLEDRQAIIKALTQQQNRGALPLP